MKETLNLFEIARTRFEKAADVMQLPRDLREVMIHPKRQLIVSVPVRMPLPPAEYQGSIYENQRTAGRRFFDTAADRQKVTAAAE